MSTPRTPLRDRESTGLGRARLALELRRSAGPFLVFAALAVGAVIAGGILLKNIAAQTPFGDYYEARVAVDDAKGVIAGRQDVRLAGVPIGRITAVELVAGRPVLTVSLDAEHAPLYRDARLRLRPATPLQDLYLNVEERGSRDAGELPEGAILSAERTRTPVDISRVLNVFDAPTRTRFEALVDELGRGLADDGEQLRATFAELAPFLRAADRLTRETAVRRATTRRLVRNYRLVLDALARRDRQLTRLIAAGSTTFAEISRRSRPLDQLLSELPPMLAQLDATSVELDGALGELDPALVALQPVADSLDPALESLTDLAAAGRPALRSLRGATRRLEPLTLEARPLARRLERSLGRLLPAAPRLDRATRAIVSCEAFVRRFFVWTPSVLKFRDAVASYPRAEGVPGPQPYVQGESCAREGMGR